MSTSSCITPPLQLLLSVCSAYQALAVEISVTMPKSHFCSFLSSVIEHIKLLLHRAYQGERRSLGTKNMSVLFAMASTDQQLYA